MLVHRSPVPRMVVHIGDRIAFSVQRGVQTVKTVEIAYVADVAVGDTILVQSIGQRAFLDGLAFLLAISANHEKSRISLILSSVVFWGVSWGRKLSSMMVSVLPISSGGSLPMVKGRQSELG